jgi:hypothetical protein
MAFGLSSIFGGGPNVGVAKNLLNASQQASGQYGSTAAGEGAQLNPFFSQEMRAQHSLTPDQENEMLTAADAGAGGAFGGAEGQINRDAARTGNATTVTKSLDEMARDKAKIAAGTSEGIAAQDVAGAKQLNQEGAAGMQGLYGTNVGAQLGTMKQSAEDLKGLETAQTQAPSWLTGLKNITGAVGDITSMTSGLKKLFSPGNSNDSNN